jgi:hypothetical protein
MAPFFDHRQAGRSALCNTLKTSIPLAPVLPEFTAAMEMRSAAYA